VSPHDAAITLCVAAAAGVALIVLAARLRVPSIALLLLGGIGLGPEALGLIDPASLGPGLEAVVTLTVAVVLFQGGLTLDIAGFRREPTVIVRMLTVGVLITWAGTAAAVYLLRPELEIELAVTAGSLVIVTGPTVVSPLLRRIGVQPRLHHILYWEGVLIDAIGVFLAVLCYEWIASTSDELQLVPLGRFASRFLVGAGIGLAVGLALGEVLRRRWIHPEHTNIVVLAGALLALGLSNAVLGESGILATIVAGLVLGQRNTPQLKELRRFKLELTELGIGLLFVLLAARLDLSMFLDAGGSLLAILAVLLFVLRPLTVQLATWGQSFTWQERTFLSWLAPRGIVAASMSSLFALRLQALGYAEARFLETFTYAVIGTTVIVQGLSAGSVAWLLGLKRRSRATWLLIGDPHLTVLLHRRLRLARVRSLVLAPALPAGEVNGERVDAVAADVLDPGSIDDPRIADVEAVLALDGDPERNDRICAAWSAIVGPTACYRWDGASGPARPSAGRTVWRDGPGPSEVHASIEAGTHSLDTVEVGTREDARRFGASMRPLIAVDDGRVLLLDGTSELEAESVVVLRRRTPGLYGVLRDAIIVADDKPAFEGVVSSLLELASRTMPGLPRERHLAEILDRERTMPTTIGGGVAIPHLYDDGCERSTCLVASIPGGLDLHGPDHDVVRLVFLLISPPDQATEHLRSLAAIAHIASDTTLVDVLVRQRTQARLLGLLRERE
jgi:NhaP-type Na+/H+ or K+/H+ antiporter/mannitol/fructose-specific phosphotransferase system IIA component (Ntr-type)